MHVHITTSRCPVVPTRTSDHTLQTHTCSVVWSGTHLSTHPLCTGVLVSTFMDCPFPFPWCALGQVQQSSMTTGHCSDSAGWLSTCLPLCALGHVQQRSVLTGHCFVLCRMRVCTVASCAAAVIGAILCRMWAWTETLGQLQQQ
jgi:hypothetical protein